MLVGHQSDMCLFLQSTWQQLVKLQAAHEAKHIPPTLQGEFAGIATQDAYHCIADAGHIVQWLSFVCHGGRVGLEVSLN